MENLMRNILLECGLKDKMKIFINLTEAALIEHALGKEHGGQLSSSGALVIRTGKYTGRAAKDKYVVVDSFTDKVIDWQNSLSKLDLASFASIKNEMLKKLEEQERPLYVTTRSVSAHEAYAMEVILITPSPAHALFASNIFRPERSNYPLGSFKIFHDPNFHVDPKKYPVHSSTIIAINFSTQEIIIAGTAYAGEIKKSIFSVLNTLLPDYGILPMHAAANVDNSGKTSLFFGLSGTGKTTLSTDSDLTIIGDDEHGLGTDGIFNFEGGCYAKTDGLKLEREPDIFKAANHFKSLMENVMLDEHTRIPNFDDRTITENGRVTYSLNTLEHSVRNSKGAIPSNIFFLAADALGVLPAVSLLSIEQAHYFFLTGYSAKVAGTEAGTTAIEATFSHCFGAPFMMRPAIDYAELLTNYLEKFPTKVWLINTGWYGGRYGANTRYPLSLTRSCIRAIMKGVNEDNFEVEDIFKIKIPRSLENVDPVFLSPVKLWADALEYKKSAMELKLKFDTHFQKYN
jgi:phosphoenolpyruvate carboxykinase (ATP)